ncbi:hypothetical protein BDW22DRAFT_1372282 [Trametopsis cervina]|nr:hypothetical protein BDW22DRAFT_1372282 [Trametopsis cervina]
MDAKAAFNKGIVSFKTGRYEVSLDQFNEAISLGLDEPTVYDSRALVFDKLGRTKEALFDARQAIHLNPSRWQGYARSARLFSKIHKYDSALTMINMGIDRLKDSDGKRLSELQTLRTTIENERAARVEQQRLATKKTFYHFGTLPIEIAVSIFSLVVEADFAFVIVLGQICRDWRGIVVSTPALWSTLSLSTHNPVAKAKLWMTRSQGKLRTLYVMSNQLRVVWALETLRDISLDTLRSIKVWSMSQDVFMKALPQVTPEVLSHLDSVELRMSSWDPWFKNTPAFHIRHLASEMTKISWSDISDRSAGLAILDYKGDLWANDIPQILWLLSNNHETMESLSLCLYQTLPSIQPLREPPVHVALSKLSSLSLRGAGVLGDLVLAKLTLPNLRSIKLVALHDGLDRSLKHLLDSEVGSRLESFTLGTGQIFEQDTVIQILQAATRLESITLTQMTGIDRIVEALARSPDTPTQRPSIGSSGFLCPQLKSVDLSRSVEIREGPIVRMVKARNGSALSTTSHDDEEKAEGQAVVVARLDSLVIDHCERVDPGILPWLRQQVEHVSCQYATKKQASWKR